MCKYVGGGESATTSIGGCPGRSAALQPQRATFHGDDWPPPDHRCTVASFSHVNNMWKTFITYILLLSTPSCFRDKVNHWSREPQAGAESTPRRIKGPINEHSLIYNRNNKSSRKDCHVLCSSPALCNPYRHLFITRLSTKHVLPAKFSEVSAKFQPRLVEMLIRGIQPY